MPNLRNFTEHHDLTYKFVLALINSKLNIPTKNIPLSVLIVIEVCSVHEVTRATIEYIRGYDRELS